MYGITSMTPASRVNFGQSTKNRDFEQPTEYDYQNDFSSYATREDIERARDNDVSKLRETQDNINEFAKSLEQNDNKFTKKLGKGAKFLATVVGLVVTYTTAKYGAKISMNILKDLAKSPTAKKGIDSIKTGMDKFGKLKEVPLVKGAIDALKNSSVGKTIAEIANKPAVQEVIRLAKESQKSMKKVVTPTNVQSAIENTLAASTTASVLIDNLAGRNDDKSMLEIAMGESGGDK